MQLGSSVVGTLYGGQTSAFAPPPATYPENNQTVTAMAFGPQGSGGDGIGCGHIASWVSVAAFGLLLFIYWGLPR